MTVSTGSGSGDLSLAGTTTALDQVLMTSSVGSINGSGLVTGDTVALTAAIGIGNATGIELSASNISADTTSGDLEIDNVLGTSVNVTSLTTGSGSIDFDQSGGVKPGDGDSFCNQHDRCNQLGW